MNIYFIVQVILPASLPCPTSLNKLNRNPNFILLSGRVFTAVGATTERKCRMAKTKNYAKLQAGRMAERPPKAHGKAKKNPNNLLTPNIRAPNKRAQKYFYQWPFGQNELRYRFSVGHVAIFRLKTVTECSFHYEIAIPLLSVMTGGGRENIFLWQPFNVLL